MKSFDEVYTHGNDAGSVEHWQRECDFWRHRSEEAHKARLASLQWLMSMDAERILVALQRGDMSVSAARTELEQGCKEARP